MKFFDRITGFLFDHEERKGTKAKASRMLYQHPFEQVSRPAL
jgi:hypothetical protein